MYTSPFEVVKNAIVQQRSNASNKTQSWKVQERDLIQQVAK